LWAMKSQDWTIANRQAVPLIALLCLSIPLAFAYFIRWKKWLVVAVFPLLIVMSVFGKAVAAPDRLSNNALLTNVLSLGYNRWDTLASRLRMFSSPENYRPYNNEKPLSNPITYQIHATLGQFINANYPEGITI